LIRPARAASTGSGYQHGDPATGLKSEEIRGSSSAKRRIQPRGHGSHGSLLHWKIIYDHAMNRMFTVGLLLTLSLSLLRAQPPRFSGFSDDDSSLRGVKPFEVVVEKIQKNAPGLTPDDFQTDVELRCRQAGIRLGNTPGVYFYVNVGLQELFYANGRSEGVYALSIRVEFRQPVLVERDPSIRLVAPTWTAASVGIVDARDLRRFCRDSVRDKVDKFLNAFLQQNPPSYR
jgi:hypothetical protein